jgi:Carbohydrate binding domain
MSQSLSFERVASTRPRAVHSRSSQAGPRRSLEIGVHALRRWLTRSSTPATAALVLAGCSLQNFDALSRETARANAGAAGAQTAGPAGSVRAQPSEADFGENGGTRSPALADVTGGGATQPGGGAGGANSGTGASSRAGAGGGEVTAPTGNDRGGSGGAGELVEEPSLLDAGTTLNLLSNPGFEFGHAGWIAFGGSAIVDVEGAGRDGSRCISSVNRSQTFEGPARDIASPVVGGNNYFLEAWVRMTTGQQPISISVKTACQGQTESYSPIVSGSANADEWTRFAGEFTAPTCALKELRFYVEGPPAGVSFYVDDAGLYLSP